MSEKKAEKYVTVPGQRGLVRIAISKVSQEGQAGPSSSGEEEATGGYLPPSYLPEDEAIPLPAKGTLQFFLLGTRLTSTPEALPVEYKWPIGEEVPEAHTDYVNEYVDIAFDLPVYPAGQDTGGERTQDVGQAYVFLEDLWAVDEALLGSRGDSGDEVDIFGTTPANGGGAALPNVLLIPHPKKTADPEWDEARVFELPNYSAIVQAPDSSQIFVVTGETPDKERAYSALSTTHWGPQNVLDRIAPFSGAYSIPKKKKWANVGLSLGVPIAVITNEPRYPDTIIIDGQPTVPSVALPEAWTPPVKVYLPPSWNVRHLASGEYAGAPAESNRVRPYAALPIVGPDEVVEGIPPWPRKLLAIILDKGSPQRAYYFWNFDSGEAG